MKNQLLKVVALGMLLTAGHGYAQNKNLITVKANEVKAAISPTMWGVFFEDINFGADGGIYAELIKNRSFEFFKPLMGWTLKGKHLGEGDILVLNRKEEKPSNPRFIRVTSKHSIAGDLGMENEGFRGMGIKQGMQYHFSVMYRQAAAGIKIHVQLINAKGKNIGDTLLDPSENDGQWHTAFISFRSTDSASKACMNLWFEGDGVIDLDMISLFPDDTWKHRPGGMRADMVQLLADMKPGFVRFPGGCIVEGFDLSQRYQWKKTIGALEDRQLIISRWNFEMAHRPAPDYFQTFGLGFFEYFQLAEDIGAAPLPILNCGMACQFNSAEVVPVNDIDPYVQDALDLIEFANGDVNSKWGKVRAQLGHPAPFNMKMLGVGNENWGPQYIERVRIFTEKIKEKYPGIQLVNSAGTDPNGERFDYLNGELRKMHADIIDEHYYRRPEWFLQNAMRYDTYPRNGSRVFAGEYAAQSDKTVSVHNTNNWQTALSEAAFMTGLERNADVVCMASYAPLFAHADGWQWTPDLIWVDNLRSYGTPNYFVQQLFSLNKGTAVVPVTQDNTVIAGQDSLYASACIDSSSHDIVIKLVNVSGKPQQKTIALEGVKKLALKATVTILQSNELNSVNAFDHPLNVAPAASTLDVKERKLELTVAPCSFTILRINTR